jgi:hypothetical protein
MGIAEAVRGSTWHRPFVGRRVMDADAPFFAISQPDDGDRDAQRRQALATTAHLDF